MNTILVVDDERQICQMVATALGGKAFSVLTASSGAEAIAVSRSCAGGVDLLLTDLEMPGMNGVALARELRATSPGIPVIVISGSWDPAILQLPQPAEFVSKPFSVAQLVALAHTMASPIDRRLSSIMG